MNAMDQWVLRIFYGIGATAGLVACALAVLIGLVLCFQIPWWLWQQTETWIRIAKIFRKAARLRKRWKSNNGFGLRL